MFEQKPRFASSWLVSNNSSSGEKEKLRKEGGNAGPVIGTVAGPQFLVFSRQYGPICLAANLEISDLTTYGYWYGNLRVNREISTA